jgi:hypothetical protein
VTLQLKLLIDAKEHYANIAHPQQPVGLESAGKLEGLAYLRAGVGFHGHR